MTNLIRIPQRFHVDHMERDLPTPKVQKRSKRHFWIAADDPALEELLNDAEFYADPWGPWTDIGLRSSARATAAAIRRHQCEAPARFRMSHGPDGETRLRRA
jgi:hypothetical protein